MVQQELEERTVPSLAVCLIWITPEYSQGKLSAAMCITTLHGHSPLPGPHVRDKETGQSVSDRQSETCSHGTVLINVTVTQAYAGRGGSYEKKPMSLASTNIRPLDKRLMGAPFHGLGSDQNTLYQTFKVDMTRLRKAFIHADREHLASNGKDSCQAH